MKISRSIEIKPDSFHLKIHSKCPYSYFIDDPKRFNPIGIIKQGYGHL